MVSTVVISMIQYICYPAMVVWEGDHSVHVGGCGRVTILYRWVGVGGDHSVQVGGCRRVTILYS